MSGPSWYTAADCSVADLAAVTNVATSIDDFPWAAQVLDDILIYSAAALRPTMSDPEGRRGLQAELARALSEGPGVVVFSGAFGDLELLDAVSGVFDDLIDEQRSEAGAGLVDRPTDRVVDAMTKLATRAPDLFARYSVNDVVGLAAQAWLGPGYHVSSQVSVVNPGNAAQDAHRDSYLAGLPIDVVLSYPAHVHLMSSLLTLQGFVAHTDMPVESGPVMLLPQSQKYAPGYVAVRQAETRAYFVQHAVQLPLFKGDAVFFNSAVMHAAGANSTRMIRRMANLLEFTSAFARPSGLSV